MEPRPTLHTVARAAGVTVSTVSYALRNHPRIPVATRERIQKVAEEVGYCPNAQVAALMAHIRAGRRPQDSEVVAWVNPYPEKDFFEKTPWVRDFWEGAKNRALQLGYKLENFWLGQPQMTQSRLGKILVARGIRCVLIPPMRAPRSRLCLPWDQLSAVCLGRGVFRPSLSRADIFEAANVSEALRRAIKLRRATVGLTVAKVVDESYEQCYSMRYGLMNATLPENKRIPIHRPNLPSPEYVASFLDWFKKHKPQVVVCRDYRVLDALKSIGVRVPEDVALIHTALSPDVEGWSGVDPLEKLVAAAAVDAVVAQASSNERGIPESPKEIYIRGKWKVGFTT